LEGYLYSDEALVPIKEISTQHYNFLFPEMAPGKYLDLGAFAENSYYIMSEIMGEDLTGKTDQKFPLRANGWAGRERSAVDFGVTFLNYPGEALTFPYNSFQTIFLHELGHVFEFTPPLRYWVNTWFGETINNVMETEVLERMWGEKVAKHNKGRFCYDFFDYLNGIPNFPPDESEEYAGQLLMYYLQEEYGWEFFRHFVQLWGNSSRTKIKHGLIDAGFYPTEVALVLFSYIAHENLAELFQLADFNITEARINEGLNLISELDYTLSDFPKPFVDIFGEAQSMLTPGACDPRGPCNPAHTIDVAAGQYLSFALGTRAPGGGLEVYMDWEVTNFNDTHVYEIYKPGNVVAFGSPAVNTVSWYYHNYLTTSSGESVLPAYMERDGSGYSGQFIHSKSSGIDYRMDNDYGQGVPVTDYAMVTLYHDTPEARWVLVVAGLSGYSTREAATWLSELPSMDGNAIILEMYDAEGDGNIEEISIVDTVYVD
jgi:hypothetical protein